MLYEVITPFILLEENSTRTYIAQSGLVGPDGIDSHGRAQFTATANRYELQPGQDSLTVDLHWQNDAGVKVTKRFLFQRGKFLVNVEYSYNFV